MDGKLVDVYSNVTVEGERTVACYCKLVCGLPDATRLPLIWRTVVSEKRVGITYCLHCGVFYVQN